MARPPTLTISQILQWADDHFEHTSSWPNLYSGPIRLDQNENWRRVDNALRLGLRGLAPGGDTLACLLERERGHIHKHHMPPLTEESIVVMATEHYAQHNAWPNENTSEQWENLNQALRDGLRGLPGGDSLAALLARTLGIRNRAAIPQLTEDTILAWADLHFEQNGEWPVADRSGEVEGVRGETWLKVDQALKLGTRGLPGGASLARLLAEHRGYRNSAALPRLTTRKILRWADAHHARTGTWPTRDSGPVADVPGENWHAIDVALHQGLRGLTGGGSLVQLVKRNRRDG